MSNNSLDKLYAEFGDNICLYPFFGAFYQTNNVIRKDETGMPNSIRPCSLLHIDDQHAWDVVDQSIHNSRNTELWKEMRTRMLNGEFHEIYDCKSCSYNEKTGATSPRVQNNKFLINTLSVDINKEIHKIISNDNTVNDIITLDYYPSNYCNYACIMCDSGASSKRHTFEIKHLGHNTKIVVNDADPDFFDVLDRVEIINFTGGETVLQKQVFDVMDHLIQTGRSKDVLITLLTNGSSSYTEIADRLSQFKKVIYNVSIDGVNDVGESQRRDSNWKTLDRNARELFASENIGVVINYVLTAVNVFSFMEFIDWLLDTDFGPKSLNDELTGSYVNISPVFRYDHLGQSALPPELRELALSRLTVGLAKHQTVDTPMGRYCTSLIQRVIDIINTTPHDPNDLDKFKQHIKQEDLASNKTLIEVVPEWAPYFQS